MVSFVSRLLSYCWLVPKLTLLTVMCCTTALNIFELLMHAAVNHGALEWQETELSIKFKKVK